MIISHVNVLVADIFRKKKTPAHFHRLNIFMGFRGLSYQFVSVIM